MCVTLLAFVSQLSLFPSHLADEDILLNVRFPEANNGMLVLRGDGIRVPNPDRNKGDFVVDALTIYCPLVDVEDFKNKRIKAHLLPDGSGIEVTWPTLPDYFRDNVRIQGLEDTECERTALRHSTFVTSFKNDEKRQLKKIFLNFPDKITCNSKHFNAGKENGQLKTHFCFIKAKFQVPDWTPDPNDISGADEDGNVEYIWFFVFWKVIINKKVSEQVAHDSVAADETNDDLVDAMRLLRKMGV